MMQQINLYRGIVDLQPELSFRRMLWIWGIFFIALMVLQGILMGLAHIEEKKLLEIMEQQTSLKQQVDDDSTRLKEVVAKEGDEALQSDVDLLTKNKLKKMEVLAFLKEKASGDMHGFSEYLMALSRNAMEGVWFTGMVFKKSGQEIELSGKSKEVKLIPVLLQSLGKDPIYDKKSFSQLEVTQEQTGNPQVSFDVKITGGPS